MRSVKTVIALIVIRRARRRNRMLGVTLGYLMLRRAWDTLAPGKRPPLWARISSFMLLGPGVLDRP